MESLGRSYPLVNGNRRLAWTATWFFLGVNGHLLSKPLDDDAAFRFVLDVVRGKLGLAAIASGLQSFAA